MIERTMPESDTLRRFVFERYPFRGQLGHMGPSWRAMMEHHDYPRQVRDSLGEAVAATVLLSSTLKYEGLLSLQLRGDGPMHLMLVECSEGLAIRAVARFRDPPDTRDLRLLSGDGTLTVTIENDDATNRYQGIVPLAGAHERVPARYFGLRQLRRGCGARRADRKRTSAAAIAGDLTSAHGQRIRRGCAARELNRTRGDGADRRGDGHG
jgi:hypothetical protein